MADNDKSIPSEDMFVQIPRVYSNAVKVSFSLYDFQLVFGNASLNNLVEEPQQVVTATFITQLSPQHAKVLSRILVKQLARYEKQHGEIAVPDDLDPER